MPNDEYKEKVPAEAWRDTKVLCSNARLILIANVHNTRFKTRIYRDTTHDSRLPTVTFDATPIPISKYSNDWLPIVKKSDPIF